MIHRLVKMNFREDSITAFRAIFNDSKNAILAMPGCAWVQLMQDIKHPNVFFTYSIWEDEESLEFYRRSILFEKTWKATKALFAEGAQAWSFDLADKPEGPNPFAGLVG